jgi:hypothetical protein
MLNENDVLLLFKKKISSQKHVRAYDNIEVVFEAFVISETFQVSFSILKVIMVLQTNLFYNALCLLCKCRKRYRWFANLSPQQWHKKGFE